MKPLASISVLWCATMRFSSTVMPWNSRMFWNVRATFARQAISLPGMRSSRKISPPSLIACFLAGAGQRLDLVRRSATPDARQRQASFGRLVEAGDAIEHRRLAGAVGADQRGDVAAADLER